MALGKTGLPFNFQQMEVPSCPAPLVHLNLHRFFRTLILVKPFNYLGHLHECMECKGSRSTANLKFQSTASVLILFTMAYINFVYALQRRRLKALNKVAVYRSWRAKKAFDGNGHHRILAVNDKRGHPV